MNRTTIAALTALPLLVCNCAALAVEPAPPGVERELAEVRGVELRVLQSSPPRLSIIVRGVAPTPGYTKLRLRPFQYIQAPPDGVYDYSLVGTPPTGIVPAVTAPVRLTETLPYSSNLKGVRVHAQSSSVTARISDAPSAR